MTFSQVSGYVELMDAHSPSMTVLEAFLFSARLRLPRGVAAGAAETHARQVVTMLNLQSLAHAVVGTRGDGLSVEQLKRVKIGVEMAANPAVLFLDEPTSGLDSMGADLVLDALMAVKDTVPCAFPPSGPRSGGWEGGVPPGGPKGLVPTPPQGCP